MPEAALITTTAELEQVAELLQRAEAVAVDTEFFWERTFYPILGLVQLATADGASRAEQADEDETWVGSARGRRSARPGLSACARAASRRWRQPARSWTSSR